MPEQPQWSERTLDMPPQDPWSEQPTAPGPTAPGRVPPGPTAPAHTAPLPAVPGPDTPPFSRGRARVTPRPQAHRFTAGQEPAVAAGPGAAEYAAADAGWPDAAPPRRPLVWHVQQLRRGGEWSSAAALFAFVCWGIWALSTDGDLTTSTLVFAIGLIVAVGLFALARLIGRIVWERQLGRVRRTARAAHLAAAVFLAGVGLAHLQQTPWVMDAYRWVVGLF